MISSFIKVHAKPSEEARVRQMEAALFPPRYTSAKLSDFWERPGRPPIAGLVRWFRQNRDDGGNVLLRGGFGTGKTWLAAALARDCVETDKTHLRPLFIDWTSFLSTRKSWGDYGRQRFEAMEVAKNAPLLIVDDYGKGGFSASSQEQAFELINERYSKRRPTIVTTNDDLERLAAANRKSLNAAIYDRLIELGGEYGAGDQSLRRRR